MPEQSQDEQSPDADAADQAAWTDAGLYDAGAPGAADRLGLLRYLRGLGCSLEEMTEAHAAGRLFALSGDRIVTPAGERFGTEEAAAALCLEPAFLRRVWQTFGLPDPDLVPLSAADVEALRAVGAVRLVLGDDATLGMCRVIGSALARVAEAASSAMRGGVAQIGLLESGSEEVTARAFAASAELVPDVARLMDSVWRHQLVSARKHFEAVQGDGVGLSVRCGVGFADLSGFTTLSRQLELAELSKVLVVFEDVASTVVQGNGGRVVKFLGDAVMFVAPDAERLVAIAQQLVSHPVAAEAEVQVRAGAAYGDVLSQDGDYFGPPVNLAARLVDVAAPGEVLVSERVAAALPADAVGACEPRVLRGFDSPVPSYAVVVG